MIENFPVLVLLFITIVTMWSIFFVSSLNDNTEQPTQLVYSYTKYRTKSRFRKEPNGSYGKV